MTASRQLSGATKFALFLGLSLTAMGQSVLFAIFGPIARELGMVEWQVGAVISLSALVVTLLSPLWGRCSDASGRRGPFMIAVAGFGITTLVFAGFLAWLPRAGVTATAAFACLLLARVAYAVPVAAGQPAAAGTIADLSPPEQRASAMALIGAAFGIGTILGPALAAALASFGPLVPLLVIAAISFPAALLAGRHVPRHTLDSAEDRPKLGATARIIAPLITGVIAAFFAVAAVQQTLAFFVQDIFQLSAAETAQRTGLLFMTLAVANLAAVIAVSRLAPPTRPTLAAGGLTGAAGIALFVFVPLAPMLIWPAILIMGFGFGAFMPSAQGEASLRVPPEIQGATGGIVASAMAAGFIIGPIGGTALYGANASLAYGIAAGTVLLATFLATLPSPKG